MMSQTDPVRERALELAVGQSPPGATAKEVVSTADEFYAFLTKEELPSDR